MGLGLKKMLQDGAERCVVVVVAVVFFTTVLYYVFWTMKMPSIDL